MAISRSLKEYLRIHNIQYEVVLHKHSDSSYTTAEVANIPLNKLAKAVVLQNSDHDRLIMAIIPANRHLRVTAIDDMTYDQFSLVNEEQIKQLFNDCLPGVVPGIGTPYKLEMIVDNFGFAAGDIYIEAGDHMALIKLSHEDFERLMMSSRHATITAGFIGHINKESQSHRISRQG